MIHSIKRWSVFSDRLIMTVALTFLVTASTALAQSSNSIQSILNPDGSIISSATHGSYDAHGYSMVTAKDGTPRFINSTADPNDKNWDPSFTVAGVGGYGLAAANSGDTVLYVGGIFGSAGKVVTNNVAAYNLVTNTWSPLDTTSSDRGVNPAGSVFCILVNGSDVYIGGTFASAGGVAANNIVDYNTTTKTWKTLGTGTSNGVDSQVWAMVDFGGNLYAAGQFTHAGGSAANFVARWDGTAWHALGTGTDDYIYTLAISGGYLYAGGRFLNAGGAPANYIAKWDGTTWSYVGASGTDVVGPYVYSILPAGNSIYIGGQFATVATVTANGIAKWDGTAWKAVGAGVTGAITGLTFYGTKLYAFGEFSAAGLINVSNAATIDTSTNTWSPLGIGASNGTNGLVYFESAVAKGKLYIPGVFSSAGGISAFGIASWDGTNWTSLGGSTNAPGGSVYALALSGSNIYVGGSFLSAGSGQANRIAVFNTGTKSWSSLGTNTTNGVDNTVYAVAVSGSDVYVGGRFTHAGGLPANHIAMWDGTKWNTLGTTPNDGVDNYVYALAAFGSDLYVGGSFTNAGGSSANSVAKWNGTAWATLGSGTDNTVYAIAPGKSEIYFGGLFTHAGGSSANYIASWNGTNWSALGTPTNGVNDEVRAIATSGDTAFVGGYFSTAGGNSASHIAKWNTQQWTVLGAGVGDNVTALAISGTDLLVGGTFATSGLVNASHVIDWSIKDSSFSTLGDGLNSTATVGSIVSTGSDIYLGGSFSTAGGKPSFDFARYNPNGITAVNVKPPVAASFQLMQNYPNPFNPTTIISYQLPSNNHVTLKVYDVLGREVASLVDGMQDAGTHAVTFNGSQLSSGVYFYRLTAGSFSSVKKLMLVK